MIPVTPYIQALNRNLRVSPDSLTAPLWYFLLRNGRVGSSFYYQDHHRRTFQNHNGLDLASLDDRTTLPPSELRTFKYAKRGRFLNFKFSLAQELGYQPNEVRLWPLRERAEFALRPHTPVPEDDPALKMQMVYDTMTHKGQYLVFYLEVVELASGVISPTSDEIPPIIFLKHFDPPKQKLAGIGHLHFASKGVLTVSSLERLIKTRMGFASGGLKLYEESWPGCTTPVKPLSLRSLRHGDIICFQVANSDEYFCLGRRLLYPDTEAFYDSFTTRVTVALQPQFSCVLRDPNYANVLLSKSFTYDQMANRAGEILQVDPTKLRFYTRHGNFNPEPIDRNATLADMMERPFKDWKSHRIFCYKLSEMSTCQVESKRWMELTATGAHNSEETNHSLLMPTTSSMNESADQLLALVRVSELPSQKSKFITIGGGRIQEQLSEKGLLKGVPTGEDIYTSEAGTMIEKPSDKPAAILKMLEYVPKLDVDGKNYLQWIGALESVLGIATGKVKLLTTPGQLISAVEDQITKHAITASVDDALLPALHKAESGMAAFVQLQMHFTFNSRSEHIKLMKEILQTRFNMYDKKADIDHHYQKVADLSKKLFKSGFKLTEDSFIGLFFHLSLPKLDVQHFAGICRKIDERPGGASIVSNDDLLKIARAQLDHFLQPRQITLREDDENPAGTSSIIGETSNSQSEELE
ncbi:hypothetical protein KEM48_005729 [Puccinia striiformis f. sp. tritici PST-130]|nr:hypothetical protein KEM48_005729 [Puccinia striiformis f. sp. tritici PST-130]